MDLPRTLPPSVNTTPMLAKADYHSSGVTVDFPITVSSGTDLVLEAGKTYVVTGKAEFNNVTVEGGAVVSAASFRD